MCDVTLENRFFQMLSYARAVKCFDKSKEVTIVLKKWTTALKLE